MSFRLQVSSKTGRAKSHGLALWLNLKWKSFRDGAEVDVQVIDVEGGALLEDLREQLRPTRLH